MKRRTLRTAICTALNKCSLQLYDPRCHLGSLRCTVTARRGHTALHVVDKNQSHHRQLLPRPPSRRTGIFLKILARVERASRGLLSLMSSCSFGIHISSAIASGDLCAHAPMWYVVARAPSVARKFLVFSGLLPEDGRREDGQAHR